MMSISANKKEKSYLKFIPVWMFSLLALMPFLPFFINSSNVLIYRDLAETDLPSKAFWLKTVLSEGIIPRWNYLQGAGSPYYSDLVAGPLHPFNFIFLLFGTNKIPQALTVFVMMHYLVIFYGFYFLFRFFKLNRDAAILFALMGAWSGYALSANNLTHILTSAAALPWLVLFWEKSKRDPSLFHFMLASAALAFPLYGGDPQFVYISSIILMGSLLFEKKVKENIIIFFKIVFLTILASSAQLMPTITLLLESYRSQLDEGRAWPSDMWALSPLRFFEFLVPTLFGKFAEPANFFAAEISGKIGSGFFINSIFMGTLPLLSLFLFLIGGPFLSALKKNRALYYWLLLFPLLVVLSMGSWAYFDLYGLAGKYVPLWRGFRYPERISIFFLSLLFIASALSYKKILLIFKIKKIQRKLIFSLCIIFFLIAACTLLPLYTLSGKIHLLKENCLRSLGIQAIFFFLFLVYILNENLRKIFPLLMLLVALIDFNRSFTNTIDFQTDSTAKIEAYPATQKVANDILLRQDAILAGAPNRLLSLNSHASTWYEYAVGLKQMSNLEYAELVRWEGLAGNIGTYFNIPMIQGHYSLELQSKFWLQTNIGAENQQMLLNLMGARYLLNRNKYFKPGVRINLEAYPNFFIANEIKSAENPDQAREWILNNKKGFKEIILEKAPKELNKINLIKNDLKIKQIQRTSSSLRLELISESKYESLLLTVNESYFSAWRAFFNDSPSPIYKTNGWAMSIEANNIKSGKNELVLKYEDPMIPLGQALSCLWLLFFCLASFFHFKKAPSPRI